MEVVLRGLFFELPIEIGQEERGCAPDGGQLIVVEEQDSAGTDEAAEIRKVQEDPVEAVIAVDKGEVEGTAFRQELRQDDLRWVGVELDETGDPGLIEELQTA